MVTELLSSRLHRLCPIFQLSNVTGQGLDFLRTFLNLLPASEGDTEKFAADQPLEVRCMRFETSKARS